MSRGRLTATALLSLAVATSCDPTAPPSTTPSASATPSAATPATAGTCLAPALDDPLVLTQTFRVPAAGCVPPRHLLAVRCSGLADPVIVLGIRRRHPMVFLGGRFAVPVPVVPEDAEVLGVSATERVVRTATGDLLVEGAGVTRWLRLPRPTAVRGRPEAWMIGDSILDGAREAVVAAMPRWTIDIDAVVGRTASGGVAPAAAAASASPDVVVMELGTNDADPAVFAIAAESMSGALAGVPLVLWVVPRAPKVSNDAVSRALREVAGAHPNAATADWSAAAPEDAFTEDGVHLLPDRQDVFASFLSARLLAWTRAVRGEGATACLRPIAGAMSGP